MVKPSDTFTCPQLLSRNVGSMKQGDIAMGVDAMCCNEEVRIPSNLLAAASCITFARNSSTPRFASSSKTLDCALLEAWQSQPKSTVATSSG